ncbi:peptide-methionine (S)-S-oxide reductase MsrA [Acidocella sp.]|jgi:peptide-methionine (S)-S-oxide reductase|uniref:peptide-methionine (S)-S-oxide reductase MsrA n=1 Tax=Acidocella sp. TaxID=50710 RepID=UPI002F421BB8
MIRHHQFVLASAALSLAVVLGLAGSQPASAQVAAPAPAYAPADPGTLETAILSGGCFWGMQGVYEHVKGVRHVYAGYTGGSAATAQYEIVSTGTTGHAESVQIVFDPRVLSYAKVLQIFVSVAADPTELNEQGPDSGTQYRSEIWYTTPQQRAVAAAYLAQLSAAHVWAQPIVVRLDPARPFYQAETYHQDFLVRHPDSPYIVINDLPKVTALQTKFPDVYRPVPVTVLPVS